MLLKKSSIKKASRTGASANIQADVYHAVRSIIRTKSARDWAIGTG